MARKPPRRKVSVLVTCPTRGHVWHETAKALEGTDVTYVECNRSAYEARNRCRAIALDGEADCLVMVDDDVVPQAHVFSHGLAPVLEGRVDILLFPCPIIQRGMTVVPNVYRLLSSLDEETPRVGIALLLTGADEEGLVSVDGGGFGCVALSKRALTEIGPFAEHRDSYGRVTMGEDLDYCLRARRLGLTVKCNPALFCEHMLHLHGGGLAMAFAKMLGEDLGHA